MSEDGLRAAVAAGVLASEESHRALLQSIVNNHALVDGNKRLGWLAAAVFLELNGVDVTTATNDDVYDLVMDVAAGDDDVEQISKRLRALIPGGASKR